MDKEEVVVSSAAAVVAGDVATISSAPAVLRPAGSPPLSWGPNLRRVGEDRWRAPP